MSRFEIKMPKLGESITEGTIISWSVQVGDIIKEDDVLFEVNTAKVSAEIPSPVEGKVVEILFKEGDTVAVGTVVAIVDIGGENSEDEDSVEALQSSATDESVAVVSKAASEETPQVKAVKSEEERWYSPVVLQLAREAGIQPKELDTIPGTGYQGRVSKKDIKSYIVRKQSGGTITAQPAAKPSPQPVASVAPQPVTTAPAQSSAKPAATPEVQRTTPASGIFSTEGVEVKEMDRVRKVIADHMVMSKHTSPHVTNVVEVDVTKLVKWRDKNKDAFFRREGVKLTYMPAITEAVAKALAAYPQVNVSVEGYNILFKKHINVGIAVSLNDGNLIVPVVRDADRLNLNGLAVAIDLLALKARDNKLMPDDISGGTFTITNFGTFKSLFGTPIINQPQVAILGVGYIEKKPAVIETPEGDVIAIRHKMYLSLSYDHRVVDGSLGGNFLYFIKDYLENWKE
ncbi:dihydrolipoamide acetyltransferase family protein [Bacteroides cellulosilyticus]|jgi:2-oxoglutarate dehydrogenase E2 component (dihydrolipoamide succinyltransferase)|uniref:Dihydrolipoamide acetyltransferase component of pyruvate dehydrogenase complex n=1 Tax=Bacteroides cellulosilyticus TaxID=246787 RepID=A0A412INT2_9BACE|nr:dihydrolipoamide acetyltransferase family protein [Bacteroides cellulosilyticus]RGS39796.1 2-oxo acid dehydrogenase subunit E2 [Bacteroides cellulosilyticus]